MKEIFEKIKGREWDWFNYVGEPCFPVEGVLELYKPGLKNYAPQFSLADLLANKSWCIAVWGEELTCYSCGVGKAGEDCCKERDMYREKGMCSEASNYLHHSKKAFSILQQEGEEACIKYITETMI